MDEPGNKEGIKSEKPSPFQIQRTSMGWTVGDNVQSLEAILDRNKSGNYRNGAGGYNILIWLCKNCRYYITVDGTPPKKW